MVRTETIEHVLCDVCGREIYPYVKNWVEDARRRRNVRNSRDVQA